MPLRRVVIFYSKTKEKHTRGERSFEGVTYNDNIKYISNCELDEVIADRDKPWTVTRTIDKNILLKLNEKKKLKNWDINIYIGILNGFNEAFIIDEETKDKLIKEDKKSAELIKPILRGRDIKRYSYINNGLYLINSHNGIKNKNIERVDINKYKAIKKHLDKYYHKLEIRHNKGDTPYNLRNCAYLLEFDNPKIIYPNMTKYLPFLYDETGIYANQKCFFIIDNKNNKNNLKYLTGILNSKVSHFWIRWNCPELQGGTRELSTIFFANIPIPEADSKTKNNITKIVDQIITLKKQDKDTTPLEKNIDEIVYSLYGLSDEEVKVVEG